MVLNPILGGVAPGCLLTLITFRACRSTTGSKSIGFGVLVISLVVSPVEEALDEPGGSSVGPPLEGLEVRGGDVHAPRVADEASVEIGRVHAVALGELGADGVVRLDDLLGEEAIIGGEQWLASFRD